MKKLIAFIAILVCMGSALTALDLNFSAGLGALYKVDSSTTTLKYDSFTGKISDSEYFPSRFGGFFAFFDATYVEADIGLFFGSTSMSGFTGGGILSETISITALQLGLLGKFPFNISEKLTVFPLVGFQLNVPLSMKKESAFYYGSLYTGTDDIFDGPYSRFDLSQFWIRLGGGADIDIIRNIYIRPSFLWGIRFANKVEEDERDIMKDNYGIKVSYFNHGFEFRISVGYRF